MKVPATLLAACCLLAAAPAAAAQAGAGGTEIQRPRTGIGVIAAIGKGRLASISFPTPKLAILQVLQLSGRGEERGIATASYAVRAHSDPARGVVRARFGSIGKVALRFEARRKPSKQRLPPGCRGPRPTVEYGRLRGTISLEGEGGYFRFSSRSAAGLRERSFRLRCRKGRASNIPPNLGLRELVAPFFLSIVFAGSRDIAVLEATAKIAGRYIALRAAHEEGGEPGAAVQVSTLESGHGMAIGRSLQVDGGKGTLRTSLPGAHPATATLAPPAPFFGEGSFYESSRSSHSWTGSLGVHLPGLDLALTGPRFATSLCVLSPLKHPNGCRFTAPEPQLPQRARPGSIPAMELLYER